jgi:hypothetical protein
MAAPVQSRKGWAGASFVRWLRTGAGWDASTQDRVTGSVRMVNDFRLSCYLKGGQE